LTWKVNSSLREGNGLNCIGNTRTCLIGSSYSIIVKGFYVAKAVRKKLDNYFNEEFHQRISMEVTKRITNIMVDTELLKKLVSIDIDDEFNQRVSREALKWYHDMEERLQSTRNPNPELTPMC
jgi:hypothetical protein